MWKEHKKRFMGLFDSIFGGSKDQAETDTTPWIDLDTMEQLDTIVENSKTTPQAIFKHSTRCGVSRMVIGQFKKEYALEEGQLDLYYLDLIANRVISNEIANRFNVVHESPQLLVIKNGVVVKHASHGAINDVLLESFL